MHHVQMAQSRWGIGIGIGVGVGVDWASLRIAAELMRIYLRP